MRPQMFFDWLSILTFDERWFTWPKSDENEMTFDYHWLFSRSDPPDQHGEADLLVARPTTTRRIMVKRFRCSIASLALRCLWMHGLWNEWSDQFDCSMFQLFSWLSDGGVTSTCVQCQVLSSHLENLFRSIDHQQSSSRWSEGEGGSTWSTPVPYSVQRRDPCDRDWRTGRLRTERVDWITTTRNNTRRTTNSFLYWI